MADEIKIEEVRESIDLRVDAQNTSTVVLAGQRVGEIAVSASGLSQAQVDAYDIIRWYGAGDADVIITGEIAAPTKDAAYLWLVGIADTPDGQVTLPTGDAYKTRLSGSNVFQKGSKGLYFYTKETDVWEEFMFRP